jgi:hypothetical protein
MRVEWADAGRETATDAHWFDIDALPEGARGGDDINDGSNLTLTV